MIAQKLLRLYQHCRDQAEQEDSPDPEVCAMSIILASLFSEADIGSGKLLQAIDGALAWYMDDRARVTQVGG